jgi:hypothetical protein
MILNSGSGSGILNRGMVRNRSALGSPPVTSSRPYGAFRVSNLYPGLRPGLSSAVPVRQAQGRLCGTQFAIVRFSLRHLSPRALFSLRLSRNLIFQPRSPVLAVYLKTRSPCPARTRRGPEVRIENRENEDHDRFLSHRTCQLRNRNTCSIFSILSLPITQRIIDKLQLVDARSPTYRDRSALHVRGNLTSMFHPTIPLALRKQAYNCALFSSRHIIG